MGADLSINSITDAAHKEFHPKFMEAVRTRDIIIETRDLRQSVLERTKEDAKSSDWAQQSCENIERELKDLQAKIDSAQEVVSHWYNKLIPDEGYFRDSYNASSVLWRLGMSWWRDVENGEQTVEGLKAFYARVKTAEFKPVTLEELKEMHAQIDEEENSPAGWNEWYLKQRADLEAFLARAIEHAEKGETVTFSV